MASSPHSILKSNTLKASLSSENLSLLLIITNLGFSRIAAFIKSFTLSLETIVSTIKLFLFNIITCCVETPTEPVTPNIEIVLESFLHTIKDIPNV